MRTLLVALLAASSTAAQAPTLIQILGGELDRNFSILKQKGDPPPYFMAYAVTEQEDEVVSASQGALISQNRTRQRILDVTVRVGSPRLDNYRRLGGDRPHFASATLIPLEDVAPAIRRRLWTETDRTYRAAAQRLIQITSNQQTKVAEEDDPGDFTAEQPATFAAAAPRLKFSPTDWAARLRRLSAAFDKYPGVLNSTITVAVDRQTKFLVNTEGTRLEHGRIFARLLISARGKAGDGMDLATHESFESDDPAKLPKDLQIQAVIERVAAELAALLRASPADPFIGPAILSGSAAGVFFHEIFGHRVEGHRQKDESEGQTFTKSVGQPVLPEFLSVIFDPTRASAAGADLNGSYAFDDEGVKARPVAVVENGILKTFLMSRSPIHGFAQSNGHGRRQPGAEVVARQSNLLVESRKAVTDAQLRQMLIEEVRRRNKPYGLFFQQVTGGYTTTARRGLQAFTVVPLVVYRVYPDGRPDELIRGVDIVGTPLASFSKILATSNRPEVFNGYCGAESGDVPVSAVAPAILVSEIEIQRKERSQDRPPLLTPPPSGAVP